MKGINYRKKPILRGNLETLLKIRSPCPHSHASRASPSLLLADALPCKKVSFLAEQHMDLPENGVYPHTPILYRENDG